MASRHEPYASYTFQSKYGSFARADPNSLEALFFASRLSLGFWTKKNTGSSCGRQDTITNSKVVDPRSVRLSNAYDARKKGMDQEEPSMTSID